MKSISFPIACINYTAFATITIANALNLLTNECWLRFLLVPIGIYWVLSVVFAVVGIVIGATDLRKRKHRILNFIGVVGNTIYLGGFLLALKRLWPALMGI
jgi:hypothetical protein